MAISTRGPRNTLVLDRNCVPVNAVCDQLCIGTETKVIQKRFAVSIDEIYSCAEAWVDTRSCTEQDFIKLSVFSNDGEFDVSTTGITDYVFLSLLALGRLTHPEVTNASMLHAFGLESIITDCCFDIVGGNTHYEMSELHTIVFDEFSRNYGEIDKPAAKQLLRWLQVDDSTIEEFDE